MKFILLTSTVFSIFIVLNACQKKINPSSQAEAAHKNEVFPKSEAIPFQKQHEQLSGKWIWVKTICCGRTARLSTPEILNQSSALDFNGKGQVKLLKNDTLEATLKYRFFEGFAQENQIMLAIGDNPRAAYFQVQNDTLILDYSYVDLQTEWYIKKNL